MGTARTTPDKEARARRMLAARVPGRLIASELKIAQSVVSAIRRTMPVVIDPKPEPIGPQPVRQIGERWSEEHRFMVKIFSPAWAAGDVRD